MLWKWVVIMSGWTHLDEHGQARMVDVTEKASSHRVASASAQILMKSATLTAIENCDSKKGDVLAVARVAGIQAAKRTDMLIPLCHSLGLDCVEVRFTLLPPDRLRIDSTVRTTGRTGVEMEALVAVSTSALTVYDMCKAIDRDMTIEQIRLESKSGGRSGDFLRES